MIMARDHWLFRLGVLRRTGPGAFGHVEPPDASGYSGRNWAPGPVGTLFLTIFTIIGIVFFMGLAALLGLLVRWLL